MVMPMRLPTGIWIYARDPRRASEVLMQIVQMVAARTVGSNTGVRLFGKAGRIALRKVHRRPRARPGEAEAAVATHRALGILVDSGWETSSFREDVPRSQRSDGTTV